MTDRPPEKRIDHIANAVRYETPTPMLRQRRISLLGYDPTPSTERIDGVAIDLIEANREELSVSRREHPDVPQAVLELAIDMACDRGGSTIPVGSYDIQRARDQMAGDASENARLRAELAAVKAELASLRAANLARDTPA